MRSSRRFPFLVLLSALLAVGVSRAASGQGWLDWIKRKAEQAQQGRQKRVRDTKAVAATRGLGEEAAAKDTRARDYEALEWLDRLQVSDDDLERFIREGKLAP